jgi:small subunit ribosomal protein S2
MRAISLYASGIADAVIEGRSQAPAVVVGEDEFVELDENGNPRRKGARSQAPKAPAPVRNRRPANTASRGRRPVVASVAADPEDGADPAVFTDTGEAAPRSATASAGRSRTGTGNPPSRGRGGGGPRRG